MSDAGARVETLLRHGVVVTMDEERRILGDGAIAVDSGRIVAVGRDADVAGEFEASLVRDLQGALVHPGLVDAHVHTGLDLLRGLVPESSADWTDVEAPFIRDKTPEDEYLSTILCCMEMVVNGSTLYSDTGSSDDLDAAARATELVGVRGMPGHFVADRAGEIDTWHRPVEGCLETLREQAERYPFRNGGKVRCAIGIAGMETASDRLLVEAKGLAEERDLPMLMHQSWDEAEVSESIAAHGNRPIEHLADLGVLGPRPHPGAHDPPGRAGGGPDRGDGRPGRALSVRFAPAGQGRFPGRAYRRDAGSRRDGRTGVGRPQRPARRECARSTSPPACIGRCATTFPP